MRINFVIPMPARKPVGGVKVMYEYANRLVKRGHDVVITHGIKRMDKKMKSPLWYKKLIYFVRSTENPAWFKFHSEIRSTIVPEINDQYLPDADIIISTWWATAYEVNRLSPGKGKKFNLIQGYEIWNGQEDAVHESYNLNSNHIVISEYLRELVRNISGKQPTYIPNAVDTKTFRMAIEPEKRKAASICMLYSKMPLKGSDYGIEALEMVKKQVPELSVDLFSVFSRPVNLPEWINFHHLPQDLAKIYNRNSIFLSPSLDEGWGLPCVEAMASGCTLVCTDIGGHKEFAFDKKTARLVQAKNVEQTRDTLLELIRHPGQRIGLAYEGHNFVHDNFSWKHSADLMERAFLSA